MNNITDLFVKICVNAYLSTDINDKTNPTPMNYRRGDLYQWAKEAFEKGQPYFYCEPVNPDKPYGKLQLCEPKYEYKLKRNLTEEEYQILLNSLITTKTL